jgi:RNA polymerase sigma-70 factor (ECF subfamily)
MTDARASMTDTLLIHAIAGDQAAPEPPMIDENAFRVLYNRTAVDLRNYVIRVLGGTTNADDIVQESYLRLVRTPPPTTDQQQLRAWLFRIASRLLVDHWRRARRERGDADTAEPVGAAPDLALRVDMARTFSRLSPQQRQMMWLAYVEGADHREIASQMNLREGSVRVLLHRARRRLARFLGERRNPGSGA